MKIEILCLFLLITYTSSATLAITGVGDNPAPSCSGTTYTFTLTGTLTGTTTASVTLTATTNPITTASCVLPKTDAEGSVTLTCTATDVSIDGNYAITALAKPDEQQLSSDPTISGVTIPSVNCPSQATNPTLTFTASGISTGTCDSKGQYTFKVNGELSAATNSAISITTAFTSPATAPTYTCSLPITSDNLSSAYIECTITSVLSSDTITIGSMTGTGITISGLPKSMTGTATCSGKTESEDDNTNQNNNNSSDDDGKFIQVCKFVILTIFLIF